MATTPERIKIRSFGGEWEFIALTKKGTPRKTAPRVGELLRLGLVRKHYELMTRGSGSTVSVLREDIWNLGSVQIATKDSLVRLNKSVADIHGPKVVFYEIRGEDVYKLDAKGKKIPVMESVVVRDADGSFQYETFKVREVDPKTGKKKLVEKKRRKTKLVHARDPETEKKDPVTGENIPGSGKKLYETERLFGAYSGPDKRFKTRPVVFDADDATLKPLRYKFYKESTYEQILNTMILSKDHSTVSYLNLVNRDGMTVAESLAQATLEIPDYQAGDELQIKSQFTMPNGTPSGINIKIDDLARFVPEASKAFVKSFASLGYRFTNLKTLDDIDPALRKTKFRLEQNNIWETMPKEFREKDRGFNSKVAREELFDLFGMKTIKIEIVNLTALERQSEKVAPNKKRRRRRRR